MGKGGSCTARLAGSGGCRRVALSIAHQACCCGRLRCHRGMLPASAVLNLIDVEQSLAFETHPRGVS